MKLLMNINIGYNVKTVINRYKLMKHIDKAFEIAK